MPPRYAAGLRSYIRFSLSYNGDPVAVITSSRMLDAVLNNTASLAFTYPWPGNTSSVADMAKTCRNEETWTVAAVHAERLKHLEPCPC